VPEEIEGPESASDFELFATESGVMDWLHDGSPGEEVSHEAPADTGEVERPRDDQGRFISAEAEEPDETEEPSTDDALTGEPDPGADAVEAALEPEDDDEIVLEIDDTLAQVLERYDGDVGKALKALADKESFTGRQANEIGQLRQELAALRQDLQQAPQQQQFYGPYQNDLDSPKELVAEALERGDTQTMELAIRAWGEEEPFEAAAFLFSLSAQYQQEQSQPEPVAPQGVGRSIETAMADVVERHPDVEKYLPALNAVAQEFPTLRNFMQQGTPTQQAQAFEELLVITKTRSQGTDTSAAMKRVILKTQEEVRKDKADAQVVSAQNQTAATSQPSKLEQFYEMFEEASGQLDDGHWIHRT
jgi:hypothetical protein